MTAFVALLRGVNVGGRNKLPMASLRAIVEAEGGEAVSSYIQSGNVVFRAPDKVGAALAKKLTARIMADFGFAPDVVVLDLKAFNAALKKNPFQSAADPSKLLVMFLNRPAERAAIGEVKEARARGEKVKAAGGVVFFHAPAGIARSKAGDKLARLFPDGTMRNWRTCLKIEEMLGALEK